MPRHSTFGKWIAFTGLVAGLAFLTIVDIYDLDFGFYLAAGRQALSGGLETEFYRLHAYSDIPWKSPWLLAAPLFAIAWNLAGPAGLVIPKAIGYSTGFLLAFRGATNRRSAPWLAAVVTILLAAAVSPRFVERPGLFSAALLGAVVWMGSSDRCRDFAQRRTILAAAGIGLLFSIWAFLHAEWYIGLGVLAFLAMQVDLPARKVITLCLPAAAIPFIAFALIHPSGVLPLLGPFKLFIGGGVDFGIAEYQLSAWKSMPGALAMLIALAATAVWLWRRDRRWEAALIAGMIALSSVIPRAVLPTAIVGLPGLVQAISALPKIPESVPRRAEVLVALLCVLIGWGSVQVTPWRQSGLGLDPTLDVRGIGQVLDEVPESEGAVLASYGWTSVLLSQPSVARLGVVMDGRQEAYSEEYIRDVYVPLLTPGEGWVEKLADAGIGFYCEPFSGRAQEKRLVGDFEAIGWVLVGWDNSSRLIASPSVAQDCKLPSYRFDPDRLDQYAPTPAIMEAAATEIIRRVHELEEAGLPSTRGRLAHAYLAIRLGRLDQAADSLDSAGRQEGPRYGRYWVLRAELAIAAGDYEAAEPAIGEVVRLGDPARAHVLRAEIARREGHLEVARRELQAAIESNPALEQELTRAADSLND
ncbi:hypothetical protein KQI84_01445 [bacterium]|nr:hypothetical protein [bacterium]